MLDEGEGGEHPLDGPKYSGPNDREMIFEDEKEIMGEVIGRMKGSDLNNLNMLLKRGKKEVMKKNAGRGRNYIYRYLLQDWENTGNSFHSGRA